MSLGVYVSVPFCKAKCSFCNFASGVFAAERMDAYVERVCAEMREGRIWAENVGAELPGRLDSIYFGGGTPSLLPPELVRRVFAGLRGEFEVEPGAEVTVECAPGQLSDETLEVFQREGMNRLSFGVQSFVDEECAAVGRLHTGAECQAELARVAAAGVKRVGVDVIAGLPHQTEASWRHTVEQAIESGVEHVSVYMLEVDDGSRLGREAIACGVRYGAGALPHEDQVADWYASGCEWLEAAGGFSSMRFRTLREQAASRGTTGSTGSGRRTWGLGWMRTSMLRMGERGVRWANADLMSGYVDRLGAFERTIDQVSERDAFEEALFLSLRLVEGVDLSGLRAEFVEEIDDPLRELSGAGLLVREGSRLRLTARGRMISNEVFERLLLVTV